MEVVLLIVAIVLVISNLLLLIRLKNNINSSLDTQNKLLEIEKELEQIQNSISQQFSQNKNETQSMISSFGSILMTRFSDLSNQIINFTSSSQERLDSIRKEIDSKLEKIRETVDSQLQSTLETKLSQSFKLVSERLELVHRGLGEMQALAGSVGDLKKILSNVKVRGTLGEIQLGNIIDQILDQSQYERNVRIKPHTQEQVEFAIKIPSKNSKDNEFIYLPIDSKFPIESYQRLIEAQEKAETEEVARFSKELENSIRQNAKTIKEKYIDPPKTTDFAIMFLPSEGLYAEVLRIPGLFESVQREYKVIIAGPTTVVAMLNTISLGFKALAIEKRTSEVWELLSAVKTEFSRFAEILEKVKKKLSEAQDTIDTATRKTRTIERKLKSVEFLSSEKDIDKILYDEEAIEKSSG
ncbi:DNA recombination protein RmuC [Anaerocellum diazotrophicum]|uniref:DNA recombination protein RmuC n=1 Tax=Caldicellulosiruptor diazotrophicus TaxID=2806205 RepID=A0ABN6EFK0_9FIRM|nr:DNA recombination protein RmuC [Caldicellulosiruptor diazotrophicus]BCS81986.1 DNA recombination protein RmuC [Caldicellulosiruptor diazotrophicus]